MEFFPRWLNSDSEAPSGQEEKGKGGGGAAAGGLKSLVCHSFIPRRRKFLFFRTDEGKERKPFLPNFLERKKEHMR